MRNETPKAKAIGIAHETLSGRIGTIETARRLCSLLHQDSTFVSQADFNTIRGIDSETDDLPMGRVREHWHPDALQEKDIEIAHCEDLYRDHVHAICERILAETEPG